MSYRKIEVDGKTYEYSIGKTHTKIRYFGAWPNEQIGNIRYNENAYFGCCDQCTAHSFQVTPKDLVCFINSNEFRKRAVVKTR